MNLTSESVFSFPGIRGSSTPCLHSPHLPATGSCQTLSSEDEDGGQAALCRGGLGWVSLARRWGVSVDMPFPCHAVTPPCFAE